MTQIKRIIVIVAQMAQNILKKCGNKILFDNLNKSCVNSDNDSQTHYEDSDVDGSTTCYEESEIEDRLEEE